MSESKFVVSWPILGLFFIFIHNHIELTMKPIELNDPANIEVFLSKIELTGKGFTTECLLIDVFDAGLDYPDYLKAEGEDAKERLGIYDK